MNLARVFTAASACVVLGAVVASCSGSFGSGSTLPSTMASPGFGNPTPSASPNSSSVVLTIGESTDFQNLPEIGGYGGSIAFPRVTPDVKAPAAASKGSDKAPASPTAAPTPVSIAIGASLSVVKPQDGPDLNLVGGKGKHKRTRERPARALAYITLLPTHDVTLESYPRISLNIPRDVATQYRDGEYGLALWNSGEKDNAYRLAVAEVDQSATPPPAAVRNVAAVALPVASSSPAATPAGSASPVSGGIRGGGGPPGLGANIPVTGPGGPGAPNAGANGAAAAAPAPTLPPQRILFGGTAQTLKLVANRPAVFAIYALPHPAAGTPAPSSSPSAKTGSPAPASTSKTTLPAPKASDASTAGGVTTATSPPTASPSAPATLTSAPSPSAAPTKGS